MELLTFIERANPEAGRQVPAGTVEPDEDVEAALVREVAEESGLTNLRIIRKLAEAVFPEWGNLHHVFMWKSWGRCRIGGFTSCEARAKIPGWSLNILGCRSMEHFVCREIKTVGWRPSLIPTSAEDPASSSGRPGPVDAGTQTQHGAPATASPLRRTPEFPVRWHLRRPR